MGCIRLSLIIDISDDANCVSFSKVTVGQWVLLIFSALVALFRKTGKPTLWAAKDSDTVQPRVEATQKQSSHAKSVRQPAREISCVTDLGRQNELKVGDGQGSSNFGSKTCADMDLVQLQSVTERPETLCALEHDQMVADR